MSCGVLPAIVCAVKEVAVGGRTVQSEYVSEVLGLVRILKPAMAAGAIGSPVGIDHVMSMSPTFCPGPAVTDCGCAGSARLPDTWTGFE